MNSVFEVRSHRIMLRPSTPLDDQFQLNLYGDTRKEELDQVEWTPGQREAFLRMQFDAQTAHYHQYFPQASWQIIQMDGLDIGRLLLNRAEQDILIVDIALLSEYRNQGVGTALLEDLLIEADIDGKAVVLRVEFFNPVSRLYARLGFVPTREMGVYREMVRESRVLACEGKDA